MASGGNVGILDSNVFGAIFARGDMSSIMSDKAYEASMVVAEIALARIEGRLGIIPTRAALAIEKHCTADQIDRSRIRRDTELTGIPVWGLSRQLSEMAGLDSGRFVHWGLNTHDIMDIAQGLQMKRGLALINQQLETLRAYLVNTCIRYRDTLMVARTHMQHALPTTFGYRAAIWLSSLDRHYIRFQQLEPRALMIQAGGASGSLASFGSVTKNGTHSGIQVMQNLAMDLGLYESHIPWHAARDGLTEVVGSLALVSGSLAKMALDILIMSMPEVGEVAEPFIPHRGASSTMPQKANPVLCEAILASNKLTRQQVGLSYEALVADFERAGTSAWHVEWACIPQSFTHCSSALEHAIELIRDLRVFPEAMKHNLAMSQGVAMSEHLVVAIAEAVGRAQAHDLVYECCREAIRDKTALSNVAKRTPAIREVLSDVEIEWYTTPENYLGATQVFIDRVVGTRVASEV